MMQQYGLELSSPPTDGVTSMNFRNDSSQLLVSSWDSTLRLYETSSNELKSKYAPGCPLLDSCFAGRDVAITVGLDNAVNRVDLETGSQQVVGTHDAPAKCVRSCAETGLLFTGSWDKTVKVWDARMKEGLVNTVPQPNKVFSMTSSTTRLVVATAQRHIIIYDKRMMAKSGAAEQERESSLKYQTRCVSAYPNGAGYALSSVEGRVAMEYFDLSEEVQAQKYAFKCHHKTEQGRDVVYPVNAIAFHPVLGTFASGGCDGLVNIWDGNNKKRLYQYAKYPTSIASLAFSSDGSLLAVASSYTHEEGPRASPADAIYVRHVHDAEVRPKPKMR